MVSFAVILSMPGKSAKLFKKIMPNEIKNIKKAAKKILNAIEKKQNIILYGDADLDGSASVIILKESIKSLGGKIADVYFPDREQEGYGITETGLDFLKSKAPALLIAADCGIGNVKEVETAKKLGFSVIIVDHHEVINKVPKADVIVDPKQKGDKYNFKGLAAAGVVFRLAEELFSGGMMENIKKNFLELVALATIADMMPREAENAVFISEGLQNLENSWRPGIKAFFRMHFLDEFPDKNQKVAKIISILNVRDVDNRFPASFRLLTAVSLEEAEALIEELLEKNKIRRENIEQTLEEIKERIAEKPEPIIFEGDSSFDFTLLSAVASIVSQKYQKPAFLYKKLSKESQGTVRVPSDVNSLELMKKCEKHLLTFGGHAKASGFRIKNENLEKFKTCLIKNMG